ncbi:MAG: hypothetical protein JSS63_10825 [Bacteroidetes bacterium]|nr:hypothetical protein [Bacteroidota bacterium]MBX7046866.1 hypothetical protein [Ignavibacteria bacterium]
MKHYTGIFLVIVCTFLGTAAQILFKLSSNNAVSGQHSLIDTILNPVLIGGFIAYGLSFLILTIALKEDDLSTLYPFIGLTYVWVSIVSPVFFASDSYSPLRFAGVAAIVAGVSFIGYGGKSGR